MLEDRCVPAFTTAFNAATGALTVTGTADADSIMVVEQGPAAAYGVAEADGVTGAVYFTGVKSIAIDMKGTPAGADDTVRLLGQSTASSVLTGALNVACSGGLILQFEDNWNVAGAVNITSTTTTGNLNVQTRSGPFPRASNMTLGPTTITHGGTGFTQLVLISDLAASNTVAINGALSLNMSAGDNLFQLDGISIAGGLTEIGSGLTSKFFLFGTTVGGFVSLNARAANAGTTAQVNGCKVGTFFSVVSGNGNDTVTVDRSSVLGLGLQPQQQTFGVDLRGGLNTSNIGTAAISLANVIHGSLFHYGAGTETFNLANYAVTSFVTINAKAGNAGLNANITSAKISGFLSCAAAGAAADTFVVSGLTIGQNFGLDLGGGSNFTSVSGSNYLGSFFQTDAGADDVTFLGNTGFGDVRLSANRLMIRDGSFLNDQIAGSATFTSTGAATNDEIKLGVPLGSVPGASNVLSVGGALIVNVGAGTTDAVTLDNVVVKGAVGVTLTANAAETVTITNTAVGGVLSINAGNSTAAVTVNLGTTTAANTGPLSVGGELAVTVGAGADAVWLTDVTAFGATTINTNGGGDTVNLEALGGRSGPSQFYGAAIVRTGSGNDTIVLGKRPANTLDRAGNPARFYGAVTFDGGDGADTLTEAMAQYFGGPPTKTNIP